MLRDLLTFTKAYSNLHVTEQLDLIFGDKHLEVKDRSFQVLAVCPNNLIFIHTILRVQSGSEEPQFIKSNSTLLQLGNSKQKCK